MQYETNLQKVEKLLERAEALQLDCEVASPEDLPRITLEWFKVMTEAEALLDGKMPVDGGRRRWINSLKQC